MTELGACPCARTREYCVTKGCKSEGQWGGHEWRFSTEGRGRDHLRRVIDLRRKNAPVTRWIKPERAVAEAWSLNMEAPSVSAIFIEKLGPFRLTMKGVP